MSDGEALPEKTPEFKDNIQNLRKADIVVSIVIFAVAVFLVVESLRMPSIELTKDPAKWYAVPGLFPGFIGIILGIQAIVLFVTGFRGVDKGITKVDFQKAKEFLKTPIFMRLMMAAGLLFVYVVVMLGHIPYLISTFIYLVANMLIFSSDKLTKKRVLIICTISGVCAGIVAYGFSHFALIPLP